MTEPHAIITRRPSRNETVWRADVILPGQPTICLTSRNGETWRGGEAQGHWRGRARTLLDTVSFHVGYSGGFQFVFEGMTRGDRWELRLVREIEPGIARFLGEDAA